MAKDWFPSIDARCKKECMICINFCPKRVFSKENGSTVVSKPDNCVTGCKSCEKICPENAITFISTRVITIDGVPVGVIGLDEALKENDFEKAFNIIHERNYIPSGMLDSFRASIRNEYKNRDKSPNKDTCCG